MTKDQHATQPIWTLSGPEGTWTVEADPDRYGSYIIEQARYEQEEWATESEDEDEIDHRLAIADLHEQANARLIAQVPKMAKVLTKFLDTIIATGGLVRFPDGTLGCAGDEDWLDLADAALLAQEVLNNAGIEVEIRSLKKTIRSFQHKTPAARTIL
jgi:hypothetical protein